jgi:hypothetical protein
MEVEELATIVAKGFNEIAARFDQVDGRFEQVDGRLTKIEDDVHLTRIVVESLRDDVKQVAEGVEMHHAELRRHVQHTDQRFDDIESVFRNYRTAAGRKRTTARAKPSR